MNMAMFKTNVFQQNEEGFASLVISLILIVVLALMTVGFAQLARREQRDALNKQLANQAYFAAESGINDTIKALPTLQTDPTVNANQCLTSAQLGGVASTLGAVNQGTSYTCVLANLTPDSLVKDPLSADTGWNTIFSTSGKNPLDKLTINWSSLAGKAPRPGSGTSLDTSGAWNSPAVLQFSLTPLAAGFMNRDALISDTYTAYLYPSHTGSGTTTYSVNADAPIVNAKSCNTGICSVTISNIGLSPGSVAGEKYILHIFDFYDDSSVSVTKARSTTGGSLDFLNSQVQIDSTGKAQEVLKRIQAVVPLNLTNTLPNNGIEVQNICKRFSTYPNSITWDSEPPGGSCQLL